MPGTTDDLEESYFEAFLLATFFLLVPIILLVTLAMRADSVSPEENYQNAVSRATQPSSRVQHSVLRVFSDKPLAVVTWTRAELIPKFKTGKAGKDIWVTLSPHLKEFCQSFVKTNGSGAARLKRRLEQRLGLPPDSDYDTFVEFTLPAAQISKMFRPCEDRSLTAETCAPYSVQTAAQIDEEFKKPDELLKARYWLLNNYYSSLSGEKKYPWTSLGYTFDWALEPSGKDFVRYGESEFIVPKDTEFTYVSDAGTVSYCTPQ